MASETAENDTPVWRRLFGRSAAQENPTVTTDQHDVESVQQYRPPKRSLGILNDKYTDEVPGSVLLMSKREAAHNEPLGLRHVPARTSASSLPSPYPPTPSRDQPGRPSLSSRLSFSHRSVSFRPPVKRTANGQIILEPQPDDSANDPLNWPQWRRDMALISLGFFCMLGGGMTTILAAGFNNVAATYHVTVPQVSLTTGLYMLGLGLGSVIFSPTAILWGKRPVYLLGGFLFVLSSVWCALSPNYPSLVVARIFQGIAVSPVECLPSATIAEIFFLHERAYRLGIYTLLLLGGKNLIPLISAAIINSLGWRWVFWIMSMMVGFATVLLFFFVPETFWDRTPQPSKKKRKNRFHALAAFLSPGMSRHHTRSRLASVRSGKHGHNENPEEQVAILNGDVLEPKDVSDGEIAKRRQGKNLHARLDVSDSSSEDIKTPRNEETTSFHPEGGVAHETEHAATHQSVHFEANVAETDMLPEQPPSDPEKAHLRVPLAEGNGEPISSQAKTATGDYFGSFTDPEKQAVVAKSGPQAEALEEQLMATEAYTNRLASLPPLTYWETLRPWNGRLRKDRWIKCAARPFVLYAYPAILWSSLIYATSVGWLIVLSESVSTIFRSSEYGYNFTALQTGLVYLSPFIGGILGTAVAGRISDVIVRAMSRRNDGVYEPEFRLVMSIPILISTVAGIMGFGWSTQNHDSWIVPTVFFGIISFGCTLGSTTAITFAVDSHREYAGEALVTLNFSKNVLHGFVFAWFFTGWLEDDGAKKVFLAIGGIQVFVLLWTVPMYVWGKRARMWTVRRDMMGRLKL